MKKFIFLLLALALLLCLPAVAEEVAGEEALPYDPEQFATKPKVVTLDNGVQVQRTPDATSLFAQLVGADYTGLNVDYMDADNRGCTACHALEDMLVDMGHMVYKSNYGVEPMVFQDCIACHHPETGMGGVSLKDSIHTIHQHSSTFDAMGGSCESCHYIDSDGNYLRWDYVKYDVLLGITDISAQDVDYSVDWDQTTVTPVDEIMQVTYAHLGYSFDHVVPQSDETYAAYEVSFSGELENPATFTLQELIDTFESETRYICSECAINGPGSTLIYQCEVTGIPMTEIIEYVKPLEGVDSMMLTGYDMYTAPISFDSATRCDSLLVYEINGEPLPASQGYPIAYWSCNMSAGQNVRFLVDINFNSSGEYYEGYGDYIDYATGYAINKPNIGVLSDYSGTIYEAGQPVELDGYAYAFDDAITKLEFSLDHGASWFEVATEDTSSVQWVYWRLKLNSLTDPGAYVLKMRATAVNAAGESYVNEELPSFLINIK